MDVQVIVALIGGVVGIVTMVLAWYLNNLTNQHKAEKELEVPVIQADFFADVPVILRDCENMEIEHLNEGRQRLAKDYTKHKITSFVEPSKVFAMSVDNCCASCDKKSCSGCNELLSLAKIMLVEGLKYEETFKELAESPQDLEALIVFNDRFIAWHQPHVDRFMNDLENACKSNIFRTCNNKGHLILIQLQHALRNTLSEMVSTALQINGQLNGKTYKSYKL